MLAYIRRVLHPAWYQGHGKKAPYFEGWYYKLINAAATERYAIIPGVFVHKDAAQTHSFVQVLDGMAATAQYHQFYNFEGARDRFEVRVGKNYFYEDRLVLNIEDEIGKIQGELRFENLTPYPVTLTAPGIMGWYGWLPFMECYHGVVSMDHQIQGSLEIYGKTVDFSGGKGYIEKDWGQSFPSGYIWMHCNHFDQPNTSLSASIARIPNLGREFGGFIVALLLEGKLYRFTTYTGAQVDKLTVSDTVVECVLYDNQHELKITAQRAAGGLLKSPERTEMQKRVSETMQASITIELNAMDGTRKRTLQRLSGQNAALEVVGEIGALLKS
jgi:hypothetical protein